MTWPTSADIPGILPNTIGPLDGLDSAAYQHHEMHNTINEKMSRIQDVVGLGWDDPTNPQAVSVRKFYDHAVKQRTLLADNTVPQQISTPLVIGHTDTGGTYRPTFQVIPYSGTIQSPHIDMHLSDFTTPFLRLWGTGGIPSNPAGTDPMIGIRARANILTISSEVDTDYTQDPTRDKTLTHKKYVDAQDLYILDQAKKYADGAAGGIDTSLPGNPTFNTVTAKVFYADGGGWGQYHSGPKTGGRWVMGMDGNAQGKWVLLWHDGGSTWDHHIRVGGGYIELLKITHTSSDLKVGKDLTVENGAWVKGALVADYGLWSHKGVYVTKGGIHVGTDAGDIDVKQDLHAARIHMTAPGTSTNKPNARITTDGWIQITDHTNSSLRYKEDIRRVTHPEYGLLDLDPIRFRYKNREDDRTWFGLAAEEVAEVLPEGVYLDEQDRPDDLDDRAILSALLSVVKHMDARMKAAGI